MNKEFDINRFELKNLNNRILNNFEDDCNFYAPRHYILDIYPKGYESKIKRQMSVDNNISLKDFCICIIASMNGNINQTYDIVINEKRLSKSELESNYVNYLRLKENQNFKIIYGDDNTWIFEINVSKVIDEYGCPKRLEVISGEGYGITNDYNLEITNKFNLEDINAKIDFIL